ncbi:hypothetical protein Plhal304r1_c049g0130971 [Plasmopara halstedii]
MHFRYLRTILLASLLATSALARTNLTTFTLDRFRFEVLISEQTLDDLDLYRIKDSVLPYLQSNFAKAVGLKFGPPNLLADESWRKWALFICYRDVRDWSRRHEILVHGMKTIFSSKNLEFIFRNALQDPHTTLLAAALLKYEPQLFDTITRNIFAEVDYRHLFSEQFFEWVKCIRLQNGDRPEETYILAELENLIAIYGETKLVWILTLPNNQNDKGQKYLKALSSKWLNERKNPVAVVKMVIPTSDSFLYRGFEKFSPRVWIDYHIKFYKRYPDGAHTVTLLDTLKEAFGSAKVAKMLREARVSKYVSDKDKEWALYFQQAQYQEWFNNKQHPGDVYDKIMVDREISDWGLYAKDDLAKAVAGEFNKALHDNHILDTPQLPEVRI